MAAIGLAITNVVLGLGNIGAGVGFDVAEQNKMEELNTKGEKLTKDVQAAGNLYDHIYFPVAENLVRVKKALDKLPSDLLDKLKSEIGAGADSITDSDKALQALVKLLAGVTSSDGSEPAPSGTGKESSSDKPGQPIQGSGSGGKETVMLAVADMIEMVAIIRHRSPSEASASESEDPSSSSDDSGNDAFEDVPLLGHGDSDVPAEVPARPEAEVSSLPRTSKLDNVVKGLDIASAVFGVAGLAATIGLGVWTLDKLKRAISDVDAKQTQITAFETAMKQVLDAIAKAAGLSTPTDSYSDVSKLAATWKTVSENCDSYAKSFDYVIQGYAMKRSLDQVKAMVDKESDAGKTFPDDAYPLTETLAGDIQTELGQNKTDKEIVTYLATENSEIGQRCVFSEYFISTLRTVT